MLGTVTGLPEGSFEPPLLLLTYDEYPKRMSEDDKYFCFGECYVPTRLVRKVDPSEHKALDEEAAARGDSFTSSTFCPYEPKNPSLRESMMAANINALGATQYKMEAMLSERMKNGEMDGGCPVQ